MSKTTQVAITVQISGDGLSGATYTAPGYQANTNATSGGPQAVSLAMGDNSIAVPAGSIGYVLQPPVGSTNEKVVSNATGTTGVPFQGTPVVAPIGSGQTTINVNAAAAEAVSICWF